MNNLNFGVIGNCKSAALISKDGSIDWTCLPEFNSSSIFAKILDESKGGSFEIIVDDDYLISQAYLPATNILVTSFTQGENKFEIVDFMPRYMNETKGYYAPPDIIRYIKYKSGKPVFKVKYDPKLEYAKYASKSIIEDDAIKSFTTKGTYDSIYLYTDFDEESILKGKEIQLAKDGYFLLSYNQKVLKQSLERVNLKLQRTKVYWLNWSERTNIYTKYNDQILRSALVLKLLSFDKTGAVLAALTTSLPETIGEIRNWDYRFCWIRDASMVIKTMTRLGHLNMAGRYMNFIMDVIPDKDEKIQIMYGINRERRLTEKTLDYLSGYENSKPVRIGNDAYHQKQNDIYGVLMNVIYQQIEIFDTSLDNIESLWTITRSIVKKVKSNWKKPDRGIWEIRTGDKHFTFSKVLCWVAIDRAIKIATKLGKLQYVEYWSETLHDIKKDVMKNAWNNDLKAFTQYYGSADLDASNLLMEDYGFIESNDPKYISTVLATKEHLSQDGLMYRYKNKDDFGLPSSSFTICTFWLINSMNKIGLHKAATKMFEELLTYSNHVGLFSEDIDFKTKRLLGNFPQAYSHLALIETAINLSNGNNKDVEFLDRYIGD